MKRQKYTREIIGNESDIKMLGISVDNGMKMKDKSQTLLTPLFIACLFVLNVLLINSTCALGEGNIAFSNDFEKHDPFIPWVNNGDYSIKYKGISGNNKLQGSSTFKLDITLNGAKYVYFRIPVNIPVSKVLNFDAKVLLSKTGPIKVGIGVQFLLEPTESGAYLNDIFIHETDKWVNVHHDLAHEATRLAERTISTLGGVTMSDVVPKVSQIGIFIFSESGNGHAILELDDIIMAGQIITDSQYQKKVEKSWLSYQERMINQLDYFNSVVNNEVGLISNNKQQLIDFTKLNISNATEKIVSKKHLDAKTYALLNKQIEAIETFDAGSICDSRLVLYPQKALTKTWPGEYEYPIGQPAGKKVAIRASIGEYEATAITFHAFDHLDSINIIPDSVDIPNDAIDLRIIKHWYQAGKGTISRQNESYLLPELLLHDDELILIDTEAKTNLMRINYASGNEEYIDLKTNNIPSLINDAIIKDTKVLKPFSMTSGSNKGIWITLHIPDDQRPGVYSIPMRIEVNQQACGTFYISVEILPFKLSHSIVDQAIYYRGTISSTATQITSEEKSREQYSLELKNMLDHGINTVAVYDGNNTYLDTLKMRKEIGFSMEKALLIGTGTGTPSSADELIALTKRVAVQSEAVQQLGYSQVFFYGKEESHGEGINKQKLTWEATHAGGGKVLTAVYADAINYVGDLLDMPIIANELKPELAAEWHQFEKTVYSYSNPQVGIEDPEIYRHNYGYALWCAGYDGAMHYAYQHQFGNSIWNDFDHRVYRDHVFSYPTSNGLIDTIQWEGLREGIDDLRYLSKLLEVPGQNEQVLRKKLCNDEVNPEKVRSFIIGEILKY